VAERKMGPFLVGEQLGMGGMGIVYLATYRKTGQKVALKVLTPALSTDEQLLKRFEREMAILKRLRHENIVRYFGGGRSGSQHFYAMELMDGGTLESVIIERKKLSWEQTINYATQIAKALELAHYNGIVHRDLKPANCFLSKKQHLKLGDFGIARDTQATALTAAGKTVGTYAYMAPEQISGKHPISRKTDLYALGCVMHEMLTGKPPFEAESAAQMLFQHLKDEPPRVTADAIDCPLPVEAIVDKLLEKDPEERYYDALALQVALSEVGQRVAEQQSVTSQTLRAGATGNLTLRDRTRISELLGKKKKKKRKKKKYVPIYERGWFLGTSLLLLCTLFTFGLWPPSEEELYSKARVLIEEGEKEFAQDGTVQSWREAREEFIEPMLERFPSGDHAAVGRAFLKKLKIEDTHIQAINRAKRNMEPLSASERLFARAWDDEQNGDRLTALARFRAIIGLLDGREEEQVWVTLARRHINTIRNSVGAEGENGNLILISDGLKRADEFATRGEPIKADEIWTSIIEVFSENREFETHVNYARQRRAGEQPEPPGAMSPDDDVDSRPSRGEPIDGLDGDRAP